MPSINWHLLVPYRWITTLQKNLQSLAGFSYGTRLFLWTGEMVSWLSVPAPCRSPCSDGASLSFRSISQTKWRFCTGIVGEGVTEWKSVRMLANFTQNHIAGPWGWLDLAWRAFQAASLSFSRPVWSKFPTTYLLRRRPLSCGCCFGSLECTDRSSLWINCSHRGTGGVTPFALQIKNNAGDCNFIIRREAKALCATDKVYSRKPPD